ncbi:protein of unknown function [Burkholderia multivorans]
MRRAGRTARGDVRQAERGYFCAAARLARAKKTGADMAPEQQRQEENGDAPATPAAYQK